MNKMSIRMIGLVVAAGALLLSACGGAAAPTTAPTAVPAAPKPAEAAKPAAQTQPTSAPQPTPAAKPTEAAKPATGATTGGAFKLDAARSTAKFSLGEMLFGKPNTVIGTSKNVEGTVNVSWDSPAKSQIGTIKINAREFSTDSPQRNGMIQRFILQSQQDQFQFITFEPTAIEGLPAKVNVGDTISFKVSGNLKIRNISKPVTFNTTLTAKSNSELTGKATAKVTRTAFDLQIPSVPSVADVTDEVTLELEFAAIQ